MDNDRNALYMYTPGGRWKRGKEKKEKFSKKNLKTKKLSLFTSRTIFSEKMILAGTIVWLLSANFNLGIPDHDTVALVVLYVMPTKSTPSNLSYV